MRTGEGIVDINVAERGELVDEGFAVLFLARMKTGIFEEQIFAVLNAATAFSASGPTQSEAKATGLPSRADNSATTGRSEYFSSRPFGRPRCERMMTFAPFDEISSRLGRIRSMRVASAILSPSIGTLRSTRIKTLFPASSASSKIGKGESGAVRVIQVSPSPLRYPPSGWKNPIRYHTRRRHGRTCRR